jgi:hypothetical protein
MNRPGAGKLHGGTGEHPGLVYDDGFVLVGVVERQDAQDGPAVVRIVLRDAIDDAADGLGDDAGLLKYLPGHGLPISPVFALGRLKR